MKNIATLLLPVVFFLVLSGHAYPLAVQEHHLENGLKVLIVEDHKTPTATFQVWYRVGSRDETFRKTGLSHLLEHLMFKGTSRYGPKTFSRMIRKAGGMDNAFTSREYTGYFELIASDRLDLPIELESDRMQNLALTPQAVLSERDVVMEERRLRSEDDPQGVVFEEVMAAAFHNHPYRWPVIGWMSDLRALNPDDLIRHYRTYYAPNNAVIIVVGDVNPEDILDKVRKTFGAIPRGPGIQELSFQDSEQRGERRVFVRKEAELPYILSAYKVPNIKHEDSFALDVLSSILSGGKSSRLYHSLVYEKQVALSAWTSYEALYKDPHLFLMGGTASQGRSIEEVEKALLEEIDRLKTAPPSEREVQKAKNQVEAAFIMGQDSFYAQAMLIGTFEMAGGWRLVDTYLEGIRKVTPDDVRRVAEKYLVDEGRTTGILIPMKRENKP